MLELEIRPDFERTERQIYVADRPVDFASWLELSQDLDTELIQGVIEGKMSAKFPHEWILAWLNRAMGIYAMNLELGVVLGSRTPVKINDYTGRLPDLLFIRQENISILKDDAVYGTPDLVLEVVSESDRPSTLLPLEADYRAINIPEIVFIYPRQQRVRYLIKSESNYEETVLTDGTLMFACIAGFAFEVEWLFAEKKPDVLDTVNRLVQQMKAQGQQ